MTPTTLGVYVTDTEVHAAGGGLGADLKVPLSRAICRGEVISLPRSPDDLVPLAERIGAALRGEHAEGVTVRMAIPAHWAFCHRVAPGGQRFVATAAAYAFEEAIPVELEGLTWAVQPQGAEHALVVAVFTEPMRAFLKTLEGQRVWVEHLVVDAVLWLDAGQKDDPAGSLTAEFSSADHTTLVMRGSGRDGAASIRTIRRDPAGTGLEHHRRLTEAFTGLPPRTPDRNAGSDSAAAESSIAVAQVLAALWRMPPDHPDLRCGALAFAGRWRRVIHEWHRCAVLAVLLFAVLAARSHWEKRQLAAASAELTTMQEAIYQRAIPGTPVPAGAALRLRSERIRMEGLTQTTGPVERARGQAGMETFHLLHELTARIPPEVRLNVMEIDVDAEGIRVSGQTASHTAAGDWVQGLNRSSVLRADPPRTRLRKDGTVDFRIQGRRVPNDEAR